MANNKAIRFRNAADNAWKWVLNFSDEDILYLGAGGDGVKIQTDGGVLMPGLKSGTDQANAGAAAGELYADENDDYTIKLGV